MQNCVLAWVGSGAGGSSWGVNSFRWNAKVNTRGRLTVNSQSRIAGIQVWPEEASFQVIYSGEERCFRDSLTRKLPTVQNRRDGMWDGFTNQ
jgi:hypothetical protein